MEQEIFVVYAHIVDANGTFNLLTGYPKSFKSASYGNDIEKAQQRAIGEWHEVMGTFAKRDDRQVQTAFVVKVSNGMVIASGSYGKLQELPNPEPETEAE